ncbi:DUF4382 domain-containing protein [Natrinema salsiterrestre]|uniref:DUF4382 domain-containing protein n=1 Tax=Natrinema salsiterrestre TaxID=2950540 RepID=A0A9Q4L3Z0_9EURY|nr:DUF4382 domain-containing protein [Natrinema salsiterrestre]MDF9747172.1 DUF4382 domain-containing protein [Natrinema salsiterrestre]
MTELNRRTYLKSAGIATAGTIGLAGCTGANAATGTLATQVTDQPGDIADFESCIVTIQGIWVKPSGDGSDGEDAEATDNETDDQQDGNETVDEQDESDVDESDGREYHEFDEPQEADLVQLQNGNTQLVDERELEAGAYEFLQLDVTGVEGVLEDGGEADVGTPGNAPLQFKHRFEIREDQTTTFLGDFTPVRRGQTERYLLQPVANGTQVEYEDATQDDG